MIILYPCAFGNPCVGNPTLYCYETVALSLRRPVTHDGHESIAEWPDALASFLGDFDLLIPIASIDGFGRHGSIVQQQCLNLCALSLPLVFVSRF